MQIIDLGTKVMRAPECVRVDSIDHDTSGPLPAPWSTDDPSVIDCLSQVGYRRAIYKGSYLLPSAPRTQSPFSPKMEIPTAPNTPSPIRTRSGRALRRQAAAPFPLDLSTRSLAYEHDPAQAFGLGTSGKRFLHARGLALTIYPASNENTATDLRSDDTLHQNPAPAVETGDASPTSVLIQSLNRYHVRRERPDCGIVMPLPLKSMTDIPSSSQLQRRVPRQPTTHGLQSFDSGPLRP